VNLTALIFWVTAASSALEPADFVPLFAAIRQVESGWAASARDLVGDGGRSIGPYQISRVYWIDSGIRGEWKLCRNRGYAERTIVAYWRRYCPEAMRQRNFEVLARVHNGGPMGPRKSATSPYWGLVQAELTFRAKNKSVGRPRLCRQMKREYRIILSDNRSRREKHLASLSRLK